MGTKGKKNIPITARVESGLFNQKKGVKEPLLNVGPAGVHGNNQTRDIPSPSKLRGYSMKKNTDSPIKQVNTNVITLGEDTPGTSSIPAKPKKTLREAYDDALTLGYRKADESFEDYSVRAKADVNFGTSGSDEIPGTPPVKGDDEVDSIPLQTRDKMDAMSPWRVRQQSRSIKKSGKDVRQSQNKLDKTNRKLAGMDKADKVVGNRKYDRLMSKQTENTNELDAFKKNMTARTRQVEMSKDPLKTGTFDSADRDFTRGEMETSVGGEQDQRNEAQIKANRIKKAAEAKKAAEDAKKAASNSNTMALKKAPNFFKSKSPMKKNYFK